MAQKVSHIPSVFDFWVVDNLNVAGHNGHNEDLDKLAAINVKSQLEKKLQDHGENELTPELLSWEPEDTLLTKEQLSFLRKTTKDEGLFWEFYPKSSDKEGI